MIIENLSDGYLIIVIFITINGILFFPRVRLKNHIINNYEISKLEEERIKLFLIVGKWLFCLVLSYIIVPFI